MKKGVFEGTLLEEVMSYEGGFHEVGKPKEKLFSEKEIGSMTRLEKVLHALSHQRIQAHRDLMKQIAGEHNLGQENSAREILEKATLEQNREQYKLVTEGVFLKKWMWDLIHLRFPEYGDISYALRPGHKIVAGMDEADMLEAFSEKPFKIIVFGF